MSYCDSLYYDMEQAHYHEEKCLEGCVLCKHEEELEEIYEDKTEEIL